MTSADWPVILDRLLYREAGIWFGDFREADVWCNSDERTVTYFATKFR